VKCQLVFAEIDRELEGAGRKNAVRLVFFPAALVNPEIVDKVCERWLGFVEVEYRIDPDDRKLLGLATGDS